MKVNFYLDNPAKNESWIYLVAFIDKRRMKFYTGMRIDPEHWDKRHQRVKNTRKFPNRHNFNRHLDFLAQETYDKYYALLRDKQRPTPEIIKAHLEEITFKKPKQKAFTINEYWQLLIDRRKADPAYSRGTTKTYVSSFNLFKEFCKKYGYYSFERIDLHFLHLFVQFLYSKDYSTNYVVKMVQQLRVMLNQAYEEGITDNQEFKKKAFRIKKTPTDEIYLTLNEINEIAKLELTEGEHIVQQCFIIQCFTGAAYADIHKIGKDNLHLIGDIPIISYYRGKTKKMAALPVHPIVNQIMEPRAWEAFKPLKNQPFNRYLKDICEAAGLKEQVKKTNTRGGIEKVEVFPKFKLIGSHTARRSFTTNYILSGGTREEVKLMIGHLKQDVTETYIKAEMQQRAYFLADKTFFNP